MKLGNLKIYFFLFIFCIFNSTYLVALDEVKTVPLINLEELSPTFEEEKDVLEEKEELNISLEKNENLNETSLKKKVDKIYINIKALDKITAKTLAIKLGIGEKQYFGSLEIKGLKCQLSENDGFSDTVAYLQVKDLDSKDNNQVFLFNGWTFVSSPTLESIDHPVYDLWITGCENI